MNGLPRKKRGPPPRNIIRTDAERAEFGERVLKESDSILQNFKDSEAKYGDKIDPALIFKIKANSPISDSDLDRMGLKVLAVNHKDAVVVFADDEHLTEFRREITEYSGEIPTNQRGAKHAFVHALESPREINCDEKLGLRLRQQPLENEAVTTLDIELWHLGKDYRMQMLSWKDSIRRMLEEESGGITDFYAGRSLFIIRAEVPSSVLEDILNLGQVARVDRPPRNTIDLAKIKRTSLDDIGEIPSPEDDSPGILIVDSGIMSGHPLLKTAIGEAQSYLEGKNPVDENGHGTAVAGVALYGNLQKCINQREFNPEIWIYSARVCDEDGNYDKKKLPETQLRNAIKYFINNYDNIKIINMSIGDSEEVYSLEDPHSHRLAACIDEIAFDYRDKDILFVVSAGNYEKSRYSAEYLGEETVAKYPHYLLDDPNARIIDPATSALALTIGSLGLGQGSST